MPKFHKESGKFMSLTLSQILEDILMQFISCYKIFVAAWDLLSMLYA